MPHTRRSFRRQPPSPANDSASPSNRPARPTRKQTETESPPAEILRQRGGDARSPTSRTAPRPAVAPYFRNNACAATPRRSKQKRNRRQQKSCASEVGMRDPQHQEQRRDQQWRRISEITRARPRRVGHNRHGKH